MKMIAITLFLIVPVYAMEYEEHRQNTLQIAEAFERLKVDLLQTTLPLFDCLSYSKPFDDFVGSLKTTPDIEQSFLSLKLIEADNMHTIFNNVIRPHLNQLMALEDPEEQRTFLVNAISRYYLTQASAQTRICISPGKLYNIYSYCIDGKKMIVGYWNNTVALLDENGAKDEELLLLPTKRQFDGHTSQISLVELSPNGEYIAAAALDNTIKIWRTGTGECLTTLAKHKKPIKALAWSPDSTRLVSAANDEHVKIWDISTGTCTESKDTYYRISTISWGSTGTYIAIAKEESTGFYLIDTAGKDINWVGYEESSACIGSLFWHDSRPYFIFYQSIIVDTDDSLSYGDSFIWDVLSRKLVPKYHYEKFIGPFESFKALFPDTVTVVTNGYGIFSFTNNTSYDIIRSLRIESVMLSRCYERFAMVQDYSQSCTIAKPIKKVFWHGDTYVTITDNILSMHDATTGQAHYQFTADSPIVAYHLLETSLLVAEENKHVHFLNTTIPTTAGSNHPVISIATPTTLVQHVPVIAPVLTKESDFEFNRAIRSDYNTITIYNSQGILLHQLTHDEYIYDIFLAELSETSFHVLLISKNSISRWSIDISQAQLVGTYPLRSNKIIQPGMWVIDENKASRLSYDSTITSIPFIELPSPIITLAQNTSGHIALADEQGVIHIYDKAGIILDSFKAHALPIVSVHWIDNGTLASSSLDNTAKIWASGMLVDTISGLSSSVNSIYTSDTKKDKNNVKQNRTLQPGTIKFESDRSSSQSGHLASNVIISRAQQDLEHLCPAYLTWSYAMFLALFLVQKDIPTDPAESGSMNVLLPDAKNPMHKKLLNKIIEQVDNEALTKAIKKALDFLKI